MNRFLYILVFILTSSSLSFSQKWLKNTRAYSTLGIVVGSDSLSPFLIRSNQYGTLLNTSNFLYVNSGLYKQYDSLYTVNKKLKRFGIGYGIEGHANAGGTKQDFRLPEAYIKVRYGAFEVYGGRRREIQGLVDTSGTMGSYIWSGNALPLPKVEVSIPNYTPIIGKGLISIKGNFAHGWFGDGDSVKNYFLHQKSFYARVGRPNWKLKFFGSFNHQVQWGGRPATPFYDAISNQTISKFGSDFATFVKVATGVSLAYGSADWTNQSGVAANEAGNRSGNHLGTVDVGMEIYVAKAKIFLYRQSVFEDGSLFYLTNISDGLNGVSLKLYDTKIIKSICFEYLNTTSQGGAIFSDIVAELRGVDNYFNNGIYKDNWTYNRMTIGNPLLSPINIQHNSQELIQQFGVSYILNNRVSAYNFKINYNLNNLSFYSQLIYSDNYGNYAFNTGKLKNTSLIQSGNYKFKGYLFSGYLSADLGNYWNKNIGLRFALKKTWL